MTKLSSKDRILRTIAGEPVDRIPIWPPIPWHPLAAKPAPGDWKNHANYQRLIPLVAEHCDFLVHLIVPEGNSAEATVEEYTRRACYGGFFDRRFFLSPPECIEQAETIGVNGSKITRYTLHTPKGDLTATERIDPEIDTTWLVEPLIKEVEDVEKLLSVPYRFTPPDLAAFMADAVRLGDRGVPVCFVTTPMVMVSHMMEFQQFLEWTIAERPLIDRMIGTIYERLAGRLQYVLDHGLQAIVRFGGCEQATPPMMSRRGFEDFILKYEAPLWQMVRRAGQIVWVHCHGRINTVLDDFVAGGVQLTDPVEPPPQGDIGIGEAKRRAAAGPLTLIGNIEQSDFRGKSADEMEMLVKLAVEEGGRKHFILGHSDVVISAVDDLTRDNLIRFIEAGVKYGTFDHGSPDLLSAKPRS
jgi:uroporphyrinogen-III decarboxylase